MDPNFAFTLASLSVQPMWLLLIFLPKWKGTKFLTTHHVVPIFLAVLYTLFITKAITEAGMMDFSSLSSVMDLFTDPTAAVAGWIHYLAFDLLIGMWMVRQNETAMLHGVIMGFCLLLTFFAGPVGFLLFTIITTFKSNAS